MITIDPYHIATLGVTGDPITIATDGFIVYLEEEIIIGGGGVEYEPWNPWKQNIGHKKKEEEKKLKKITATVIVNGIQYKESIIVDDLTISVKDINVQIDGQEKPSIKLTVMRGKNEN
jgi:hypothetical protein